MVFSRGQNKERWVQVYSASELEGRGHSDKRSLKCSVDLDLRHILHKEAGCKLTGTTAGCFY